MRAIHLGVLERRASPPRRMPAASNTPAGAVDDGAPAAAFAPNQSRVPRGAWKLAAHGRSSSRNGLVARSRSSVVAGPCPDATTVSGGSVSSSAGCSPAACRGRRPRDRCGRSTREQHVAREDDAVGVVGDRRGRVAGHVDRAEVDAGDRDRLAAVQQVLGLVRARPRRCAGRRPRRAASTPPRRWRSARAWTAPMWSRCVGDQDRRGCPPLGIERRQHPFGLVAGIDDHGVGTPFGRRQVAVRAVPTQGELTTRNAASVRAGLLLLFLVALPRPAFGPHPDHPEHGEHPHREQELRGLGGLAPERGEVLHREEQRGEDRGLLSGPARAGRLGHAPPAGRRPGRFARRLLGRSASGSMRSSPRPCSFARMYLRRCCFLVATGAVYRSGGGYISCKRRTRRSASSRLPSRSSRPTSSTMVRATAARGENASRSS